MTTVLWESDDQFNSIYQIWDGNISQPLAKIYSNCNHAYVLCRAVERIVHGSGVERHSVVISPGYLSPNSIYLLSNYITEFGMAWYSVLVSTPAGDMWYGPYPENTGSWTIASGVSPTPVDIVFPDIPESPRFIIGVSGVPHGIVILSPSGLINRYDTDWSAMTTSATVTDLEATRII